MDLTPDPALPIRRVGDYELIRRLGMGGMAEVFLARRGGIEDFEQICVVKTILPQFAHDGDFVEMFLDEARITVKLQHANIVRCYDLGRDGDLIFQSMEFIDGMDALSLMVECEERGVTVPFNLVLFIIAETLKGLHFAHTASDISGQALGLIHRDISPGNILLGVNGAVKLSDFGVARATISKRDEQPGLLVGKLRYFAPELLQGAEASVSSDIFALGTCLYEMMAMEPLFPPADNLVQQQLYVDRWNVDRVLEKHLNFPDGVDVILRRALAKSPSERYANAQHFLEDVTDLAYESQVRLWDLALTNFLPRLQAVMQRQPVVQQPTGTRFREESTRAVPAPPTAAAAVQRQGATLPYTPPPAASRQEPPRAQPSPAPLPPTPTPSSPLPAVAGGTPRRPRLAEVLTSPDTAPAPRLSGTPSRIDLRGAAQVELFTSRGRLGPYAATTLQQAADVALLSGLELVAIDGEDWQPLMRFARKGVEQFTRRILTYDLFRVGPMLLKLSNRAGAIECVLWGEGQAMYLGIAQQRVIAAAIDPPPTVPGVDVAEGLARAVRMSMGEALAVAAADLAPVPGAPLLASLLVDIAQRAVPPRQLRRTLEQRGIRRLGPTGKLRAPAAIVQGIDEPLRLRLAQGPVSVIELDDHALRSAAAFIALGVAGPA